MKRIFRFNAVGELVEVGEKPREVLFWLSMSEIPEDYVLAGELRRIEQKVLTAIWGTKG